MRALLNLPLDDVRLAQIGQLAEIRYAGLNCGIMDQMASSLAHTNTMLLIDTRSLKYRPVPFPAGTEILVIDSGESHNLAAGSGYNKRRAECEESARRLGVKALRDITDPQAVEVLPEPLRRRSRHVVTENNRVLQVLKSLPAERFGKLMNASHASWRDDYEISVPAVEALVAILQSIPGVFGARLTGGGFGGACVALVKSGKAGAIASEAIATSAQVIAAAFWFPKLNLILNSRTITRHRRPPHSHYNRILLGRPIMRHSRQPQSIISFTRKQDFLIGKLQAKPPFYQDRKRSCGRIYRPLSPAISGGMNAPFYL